MMFFRKPVPTFRHHALGTVPRGGGRVKSRSRPGARSCVACGAAATLRRSLLAGVVEDDAERHAVAGTHLAHAVAHAGAVIAAGALGRMMIDREQAGIALPQRHDVDAGLHARLSSVSTNSPPVKSRPGSLSSTTSCTGK